MKKILKILLCLLTANLYGDDFTFIIQDLAVQIACTGQYNATMAGGSWTDEPIDFYTPTLMAQRFTNMSGAKTEYQTFYGICYNYAKYAYYDVKKYKKLYEDAGMIHDKFYIVGVDDNPHQLLLLDPANSNTYTMVRNGEYLKEYSRVNISSHRLSDGTRVTRHAWLWIQRKDGIWFWIDPTFTDNTGYVVYGYVDQNTKEEIQLRPDENLCINYPSYLRNLPSKPYENQRTTKPTSTQTYTPSITSDSNSYTLTDAYWGIGLIKSFNTSSPFFANGIIEGFEISVGTCKEDYYDNMFSIVFIDILSSKMNFNQNSSWIIGMNTGYSFFNFLEPYIGAGLGMKTIEDDNAFAFKIDIGLRFNFGLFTISGETSLGTILGPAYSLNFAFLFEDSCYN